MEQDKLFKQVSDLFETESCKLIFDDHGHAIQHADINLFKRDLYWMRLRNALDLFSIPSREYRQYSLIPPSSRKFSTPLLYLNEDFREKKLENFYCLNFTYFYPHIMVAITQSQLMEYDSDIEILKYLLENKDTFKNVLTPNAYKVLRLWVLYYYGIKLKEDQNRSAVTDHAAALLELVLSETGLLKADRQIYADVDCIYFFSEDIRECQQRIENYMKFLGFPYFIEKYEVGVIMGKKRYFLVGEDKKVHISGFRSPKLF